jgi:hypothetical protein
VEELVGLLKHKRSGSRMVKKKDDYQAFQQKVFDEISELERLRHQSNIEQFFLAAERAGVDILTELKTDKSVTEIFNLVKAKAGWEPPS